MYKDFWDKLAEIILYLALIFGFLGGCAIFGWQIFHWLKTSIWLPIPFYDAFIYFGIDVSNVYNPTNWFGLAKIVRWVLDIPLFIALPVVVISIAYLWYLFIDSANRSAYLGLTLS